MPARGSRLAVLVPLALLSLALIATSARAGPVTCSLVEAGPAGPAANILRIHDRSYGTALYRDGNDIEFYDFRDGDRTPIACAGGAPTVNNIDRIDYRTANGSLTFDESGNFAIPNASGGLLEPGATPESRGSEIEVSITDTRGETNVAFGGTRVADQVKMGRLRGQRIGINVNAGADGAAKDADIIIKGRLRSLLLRTVGGAGNDRLSAAGGPPFAGPVQIHHRIGIAGGLGNDVLFGSPGRDQMTAGRGNDILRAGRSADTLVVGNDHDEAHAGPGNDFIYISTGAGGLPEDEAPDLLIGGSGADRILSQGNNGRADRVRCGSGHDEALVDHVDHLRGCEDVSFG